MPRKLPLAPWLFAAVVLASVFPAARARSVERPNVLFIVADDLRPDLGCYGRADVRSPHIDRLAKQGLVFERAYCQVALCNPSRTSFLTGLRPDTSRVFGNGGHFRTALPDAVTLPQFFKAHGYRTRAVGKIFHPGCDDTASWSAPSWEPMQPRFGPAGRAIGAARAAAVRQAGKRERKQDSFGPPWEAADATDDQLTDGETAARAIELLREPHDRPFFLAVGFLVPHLPFVAPKPYFDLYPPDTIRPAANPSPPAVSEFALHTWSELRAYAGMPPTGPLSDEQAREAVRGYRAATSFLDAQVGRLLDELDRSGLGEKTIVVFLGDHGWQLGEHGQWCKHTNFDVALRSPLVIRVPGSRSAGRKAAGLVEFVDLYPTLAELCGLAAAPGLDGLSFAPLFERPDRPWKQYAFSQFQRMAQGAETAMGRSVCDDRYRYTEWTSPGEGLVGRELYDHRTDPDENVNVADRPEHAAVVAELSRVLKQPKNVLAE